MVKRERTWVQRRVGERGRWRSGKERIRSRGTAESGSVRQHSVSGKFTTSTDLLQTRTHPFWSVVSHVVSRVSCIRLIGERVGATHERRLGQVGSVDTMRHRIVSCWPSCCLVAERVVKLALGCVNR